MMKVLLGLMLVLFLTGSLGAEDCTCGEDGKGVGPTFTVHGRIRCYNGGWPNRIWVVGTKRLIGIPEFSPLPDNLDSVYIPYKNEVFGDFVLCPLTERKAGEMQFVCMLSASHLVVREISPRLPQ